MAGVMTPVAVFTCRANSHPFQERHVLSTEPIKIGRSVARARPAPNNAIFDCKVLSRNHALLWYESGKFFLQDTKSSNGTFINNHRLSKGSEESPPHEVYSGDIVQFGVDVMENSRRVTHSCIIASIQLFHSDGTEATNSHSSAFLNGPASGSIPTQELFQLSQFLQESLQREQMLEQKLKTLQRLVQQTQEASDSGWQALIDEDRLLSRLELLENQLAVYSKNQTEDTLRQELTALQEDKHKYENTAKESLRKVLQEKLDAVHKLSDLERSLSNTEEECRNLREQCETSQDELQQLATKHSDQLTQVTQLQDQLREAEQQQQEDVERVEQEKTELQEKLGDMKKQEHQLQARVEFLEADNDFTKEQLANMKSKMENLKEGETTSHIPELESQGVQVELVNLLDLQLLQSSAKDSSDDESCPKVKDSDDEEEDSDEEMTGADDREEKMDTSDEKEKDNCSEDELRAQLKETQEKIEFYKSRLAESVSRIADGEVVVKRLQAELDHALAEVVSQADHISSLEERLSHADLSTSNMVENAVADLRGQLNASRQQAETSTVLTTQLREEVRSLESELNEYRHDCTVLTPVGNESLNLTTIPTPMGNHDNHTPTDNASKLQEEVEQLKEMLEKSNDGHHQVEQEAKCAKEELHQSLQNVSRLTGEFDKVKSQLETAEQVAQKHVEQVSLLEGKLAAAELSSKESRQQAAALKDELQETQHTAQQSRHEVEQLQLRVHSIQEELDFENSCKKPKPDPHVEMEQHQATNRAEFASLKAECAGLRQRVQDIETEMKMSRHENQRLQGEYGRLQEAYSDLETSKNTLESREGVWDNNLTDQQKDTDHTKQELLAAHDEICSLKQRCAQYNEEVDQLRGEIADMSEEYEQLSYKSRTLSHCSMVPLMVLMFGVLVALYPTLASITATTHPS